MSPAVMTNDQCVLANIGLVSYHIRFTDCEAAETALNRAIGLDVEQKFTQEIEEARLLINTTKGILDEIKGGCINV
jgi:hypothetical protein